MKLGSDLSKLESLGTLTIDELLVMVPSSKETDLTLLNEVVLVRLALLGESASVGSEAGGSYPGGSGVVANSSSGKAESSDKTLLATLALPDVPATGVIEEPPERTVVSPDLL